MHLTFFVQKYCNQLLSISSRKLLLFCFAAGSVYGQQPALNTESLDLLQIGDGTFKDHNKNGLLDAYEDWRLGPEQRAENIVSQMTVEEKAGAMLHGTLPINEIGYEPLLSRNLILERHINSMVTRLGGSPESIAEENNKVQLLAESSRLGIPLSISTDPRHHFQFTAGASVANNGFSQWPETLGFAALGNSDLVREFADIARQEYRATGINMGLSPQADLSTDPRWPRIIGTFGEDAFIARNLVQSYVDGFQNGSDGINTESVALVVKHWAGYGAAKEGFDSHNYYGRYATFPGDNFGYHLVPFEGAFNANVAGVMPTYSILENLNIDGNDIEQVGVGFNHFMLTDLLRDQYGFEGVILSDWGITSDCSEVCINGIDEGEVQQFSTFSTAWGVLKLSKAERFAKGIEAGIDQFGGEEDTDVLASVINQGMVSEQRINASVIRIMEQKIMLGLFETPFVDVDHAAEIVGNAEFSQKGAEAQAHALVLLENKNNLLPLQNTQIALYLYGIDPVIAISYGFQIVDQPENADMAIIRANTPYEILHPNYVFGRMHHEGDLSFKEGNAEYERFIEASSVVPTIVTVFLDRPAILTSISEGAAALLGNFGVSDTALMDVIVGNASPQGKLPFELPANMESVRNQLPDVPFDAVDKLYPAGFGLEFSEE